MKIKFLDKQHYLFGNKGNLWNHTAHIAKTGNSTTLCGTPMLSSNWIAIEGVQEAGCLQCIKIYKDEK